ncbi:MAG: VOC family protein [Candidatus Eremiobacteraeota bacterium]|nr:VOC family protein [Candidatus Eremiobacteraeota bacterium]MBC5828360.1 VOC family protein [Candidatus Eremiobacteraeota bacterium]
MSASQSDMVVVKNANVTLMVGDLDSAVRFYTETLQLTLEARYGDHIAVIAAPGVKIMLHPAGKPAMQPPPLGHVSLGLEVASLEDAMKMLQSRGVQFAGGIVDDPPVRAAHFHDLDGTSLYIAQLMRF